MTTTSTDPDRDSGLDSGPGPGPGPGPELLPPAPDAVATRLQWLFRQGQPHPPLTPLMQYREVAP